MNRRSFLKILGVVPFAGVLPKLKTSKPKASKPKTSKPKAVITQESFLRNIVNRIRILEQSHSHEYLTKNLAFHLNAEGMNNLIDELGWNCTVKSYHKYDVFPNITIRGYRLIWAEILDGMKGPIAVIGVIPPKFPDREWQEYILRNVALKARLYGNSDCDIITI